MQSFVAKKGNKRWLWHAINHDTGQVLAFVLGTRTDEVFLQLQKLLELFELRDFILMD
jgi:insertion element IS1 protein InsB